MLLYLAFEGPFVEHEGRYYQLRSTWDALVGADDLRGLLERAVRESSPRAAPAALLAPIGSQEVWAAGVTYYRSRTARMEESREAGGGTFYDRVYEADRPELFFKATPNRVVAPGGKMRLRSDSRWIVPEPELALLVNRRGQIIGYTVANDLSCRDIEGENPLYLPQAKVFDGCASLGPGVLVSRDPPPPETEIRLSILREGRNVWTDRTTLSQLRRSPASLVDYLFRETSFPGGVYLMTGTGIVPPDDFSLGPGDEVRIAIEGIGTLVNTV